MYNPNKNYKVYEKKINRTERRTDNFTAIVGDHNTLSVTHRTTRQKSVKI